MEPTTLAALATALMQAFKPPDPAQAVELPRTAATLQMSTPSTAVAMQSAPQTEPPSAHGRTLEDLDKQVKQAGAQFVPPPPAEAAGVPNVQQGMIDAAMTDPQPPKNQGFGGMTSLEMAQLGLALGSNLFQSQPGPAPPGLGGGGSFNMSPVFNRR